MYISEIASPDVRGFLSAIQKIAGHLGILISFSLGAYLDWRQLAMLVSIAPMLLFLTVIYIPETPSFLVLNGRDDEAYRFAFTGFINLEVSIEFTCLALLFLFVDADLYSGFEVQIKMLNSN